MSPPRVFVSYSHDSDDHKQWVLRLATDLRAAGIDATLDQWDLSPGQDIVAFMANGIAQCDRVVMVCSGPYVQKAEKGTGGVGYERLIVTGELVQAIDTKKFIPVVRSNAGAAKIPNFLGPRLYIDFSDDAAYVARRDDLIREIHGAPVAEKPPLGPNPFAGVAPTATAPARVAGPSGLTAAGERILDDAWFAKQEEQALAGLGKLGLGGSMALRFALHEPVSKAQNELLNGVRNAEIQTFGWPIGALIDNVEDYRPKPVADGIRAEISMVQDGMSGKPSYDFWALRSTGDFYLLQSLFEDSRAEQKLFADTRIVRVTESLMFAWRLYSHLGVTDDAGLTVRVTHRGLAKRTLTTASSRRHIFSTTSAEDVSETELSATIGGLKERPVDHVMQVVEPLLMLFDFKKLDRKVYEEIVTSFVAGRVV
jgi:hypothetical protein